MDIPIWMQLIALLLGGMLGGGGLAGVVASIGANSSQFRKDLLDRVKQLEDNVIQLDAKNDQLVTQNAKQAAEIEIAQAKIGELSNRLVALSLENDELKRENKQLRERIDVLEREQHGGRA